jgi:hypothetical protein
MPGHPDIFVFKTELLLSAPPRRYLGKTEVKLNAFLTPALDINELST